jgi:hypothetical protein
MPIQQKGREVANSRAFNKTTFDGWNRTTFLPDSPIQNSTHQLRRPCERNPRHKRAVVHHVERPEGRAFALCPECWRQTCATEARAALVARWNGLFRSRRPSANWLRGAGWRTYA